ncbi:MAG: peptidase [Frankiales bacterium]|nr:peptidase [Frankiales bacterium]
MSRGVLVAGIGNLFLSDDGFGSEVARQLLAGPLPVGVRVVDYGIRGMHLAYDLLDVYDALVVIDALPGDGAPGDLSVVEVGPDDLGQAELDAHGMAPVAVLAGLGLLGGDLPPTYVVGCQPADVSAGMGLTPAVAAAVPAAVALVREVLNEQLAEVSAPLSPDWTGPHRTAGGPP